MPVVAGLVCAVLPVLLAVLAAYVCSDWLATVNDALQTPPAQAKWATLHRVFHTHEGGDAADGAAAAHAKHARDEAAGKLIMNRGAVLRDLTNPSDTTNIAGKNLTQRELRRVPAEYRVHADAFLREVARRLLGRRPEALALTEPVAQTDSEAWALAWAQAATYLSARIQSTPDERPGRAPDMSVEAAAALRAVLAEVGEVPSLLVQR